MESQDRPGQTTDHSLCDCVTVTGQFSYPATRRPGPARPAD